MAKLINAENLFEFRLLRNRRARNIMQLAHQHPAGARKGLVANQLDLGSTQIIKDLVDQTLFGGEAWHPPSLAPNACCWGIWSSALYYWRRFETN